MGGTTVDLQDVERAVGGDFVVCVPVSVGAPGREEGGKVDADLEEKVVHAREEMSEEDGTDREVARCGPLSRVRRLGRAQAMQNPTVMNLRSEVEGRMTDEEAIGRRGRALRLGLKTQGDS